MFLFWVHILFLVVFSHRKFLVLHGPCIARNKKKTQHTSYYKCIIYAELLEEFNRETVVKMVNLFLLASSISKCNIFAYNQTKLYIHNTRTITMRRFKSARWYLLYILSRVFLIRILHFRIPFLCMYDVHIWINVCPEILWMQKR